jgi:hypothetical protein
LKGEIDNLRGQIKGEPHDHYGWKNNAGVYESTSTGVYTSEASKSTTSTAAAGAGGGLNVRIPLLSVALVVTLLWIVTKVRRRYAGGTSSSYNRSYRRHLGNMGRVDLDVDSGEALFELQDQTSASLTSRPTPFPEQVRYEAPVDAAVDAAAAVRFV